MVNLQLYFVVGILTGFVMSASIRNYDEEYCIIDGIKIREGDKAAIPGKCQTVKCLRASTKRYVILGCSMFVLNPDCPESELDYSKPYPLCCPHSVCPT